MRSAALAAGALALGACPSNRAPGNDREADRDRAPKAATMAAADEALAGIAPGLVHPQTMTDAEVASIGGDHPCRWRMTRVGFPVLVYAQGPGGKATVKLNDKLVELPSTGDGSYGDDSVEVTLDSVGNGDGGQREADLTLRIPGARERGFRGFTDC